MIRWLSYLFVFFVMLAVLCVLPKSGGYIWQPEFINPFAAALFTLLVFLVTRIAKTGKTAFGIIGTALFTLLFCPDSHKFFYRDEVAILELFSTCIVPFFISQYNRISTKNFKYGYFIMLLMGIFCSYTHDGITIPLCASFIMLSYMQRKQFFRLACWPMVSGFAIGTSLALLNSNYFSVNELGNFYYLSSQTATGFILLWETKVFIFATLLTMYFISSHHKRTILWKIFQEYRLLSYCLLFSFCTIPFAPLGLGNAVSGVCFFCMFWVLLLSQALFAYHRRKNALRNQQL